MESKSGLVITVKIGEVFHINENIEISVEERSGNYVKVRIKAPRDIKIARRIYIEKGLTR